MSVPATDQRILMHQMTWDQFQALLALRGDRSVPRMAFAHGTIELMSPSHRHEERKSLVGLLIEAYCFERGHRSVSNRGCRTSPAPRRSASGGSSSPLARRRRRSPKARAPVLVVSPATPENRRGGAT
ncbi:MAG: Uma2 family endonuclease [Myxococcales bacterium]|nr:Uma2 family endonuclease [Myxococcales bacterium]